MSDLSERLLADAGVLSWSHYQRDWDRTRALLREAKAALEAAERERDEALAAVGLPVGTPISGLIRHHRANAASAVAWQVVAAEARAAAATRELDAVGKLADALSADFSGTGAGIKFAVIASRVDRSLEDLASAGAQQEPPPPPDLCDEACREEGNCSGYCAGEGDPLEDAQPGPLDVRGDKT